jgi:alpha-tubulin suppressor-like RCC1 family protein
MGDNSKGQLGDGTNNNHNTPVPVHDLTDVAAISGGDGHAVVLKKNGTVWAWGDNSRSQLGVRTYESSNHPIQVQGEAQGQVLEDIKAIASGNSHSLALKEDNGWGSGKVWAWGCNEKGELGDGANSNKNSPQQILTGTVNAYIAGGGSHTIFQDYTNIYAWGLNGDCQLGDGTNYDSNTPVNVIVPHSTFIYQCRHRQNKLFQNRRTG